MSGKLNLKLIWSPERQVELTVHVIDRLGPGGLEGLARDDTEGEDWKPPIDALVVYDEDTLKTYFRSVSRTADGPIRAQAMSPDADRMLELLEVSGPPPNPIEVDLKSGASNG